MLAHPHPGRSGRDRLAFWLDSATVLVGGAVIAWSFAVTPGGYHRSDILATLGLSAVSLTSALPQNGQGNSLSLSGEHCGSVMVISSALSRSMNNLTRKFPPRADAAWLLDAHMTLANAVILGLLLHVLGCLFSMLVT